VIAVDTSLLVYAHRREGCEFDRASRVLRQLAEGSDPWAIPWPCIGEFLSVVTSRRIVGGPTPTEVAISQVEAWAESPGLVLLGESGGTWPVLRELLSVAGVTGSRVHDARIAAVCLGHGVREFWTADKDYGRFRGLRTHNPLVAA
jgi:toxin-antitoxin system PIN domain toxin